MFIQSKLCFQISTLHIRFLELASSSFTHIIGYTDADVLCIVYRNHFFLSLRWLSTVQWEPLSLLRFSVSFPVSASTLSSFYIPFTPSSHLVFGRPFPLFPAWEDKYYFLTTFLGIFDSLILATCPSHLNLATLSVSLKVFSVLYAFHWLSLLPHLILSQTDLVSYSPELVFFEIIKNLNIFCFQWPHL